MNEVGLYDVIVIGGSYAGLSAAMSLGRSLRQVLVIDSGNPCNKQTPHSHNFITQDGQTPKQIAQIAKMQVARYETVSFYDGLAIEGSNTKNGFEIKTQSGDIFNSKKLIFATGLKDILPDIEGFAMCWGISILHCPYCHGYEHRHEKTGVIGNGNAGFELTKMIKHWTNNLTLFTNGKPDFTEKQMNKIKNHNIEIIEAEIERIVHNEGKIQYIILKDKSKHNLNIIYAKPSFQQHSELPMALGCKLNEQNLIHIDSFQRTSVKGIFACGDNAAVGRSVSLAVSSGSLAGAFANKELIDEAF